MRLLILNSIILLLFCNCNSNISTKNVEGKKENVGNTLDVEFQGSYGFFVLNDSEKVFHSVDKKLMKKYINHEVSSKQILNDIKSTKWIAEIKGCRFEMFAFWNWANKVYNKELSLKYCDTILKSKIIPVYITELTYSYDLHFSKLSKCENSNLGIPYVVYTRPELNITYVEPLIYENRIDFLNMKDTINRNRYLEYIKFYCN
jgi:hypothetical protein